MHYRACSIEPDAVDDNQYPQDWAIRKNALIEEVVLRDDHTAGNMGIEEGIAAP